MCCIFKLFQLTAVRYRNAVLKAIFGLLRCKDPKAKLLLGTAVQYSGVHQPSIVKIFSIYKTFRSRQKISSISEPFGSKPFGLRQVPVGTSSCSSSTTATTSGSTFVFQHAMFVFHARERIFSNDQELPKGAIYRPLRPAQESQAINVTVIILNGN